MCNFYLIFLVSELLHACSVCDPARVLLTSKDEFYFSPNNTTTPIKTETGTAERKGARLLRATHLDESKP
jgi:hypothetical protein